MPDGRAPYVAGNWKMYKTVADTRAYVEKLIPRLPVGKGVDVGLCVPYTALAAAVEAVEGAGVKVLAQNMHQSPEGAFTGEVSAPMLL
ncbi:MAG: triosephosphate isomerase, partial [Thermoleophilaceae bacterium]|nr:triosephosphate isomerase [Thermoleophilaceae bacterium]